MSQLGFGCYSLGVKEKKGTPLDHTRTVLVAASVAAELQKAVNAAFELSLVAKNARVLVLRAGEQASGFKVISNFFNDMASNTIELSRKISISAIHLSQVIVAEWRTENFIERVNTSLLRLDDSIDSSFIDASIDQAESVVKKSAIAFDALLESIIKELEDIHQQMRAADHIILTSRIEAERAGEYRKDLHEMANQVQIRTDAIKYHIEQAGHLTGQQWGEE